MEKEQIIKALECCARDDCDNCPNNFGNCYANLAKDALALIKELAEEAQTYKKHHDIMDVECSRLEKRNDELTEENDRLKQLNESYAEAVKDNIDRIADEILNENTEG